MPRVLHSLAGVGFSLAISVTAFAVLVLAGGMMEDGPRLALAAPDCAWVEAYQEELCISLTPATDTNPAGTVHAVTATVTWDGATGGDDPVDIVVFDGPNAGESVAGVTAGNGKPQLTYTGDGGLGTDSIVGLTCAPGLEQVCNGVIQSLVNCPNPGLDPTCLAAAEQTWTDQEACGFDLATKDWVEATQTPGPTVSPAATPTEVPSVTPTTTPTPTLEPTPSPAPTATPPGGKLGDTDCDGDVDTVDALMVLPDTAGLSHSAACIAAGDVDRDGDKDSVDALKILRHVAGLGNPMPTGCRPIGK